jgi:hypothetical protein
MGDPLRYRMIDDAQQDQAAPLVPQNDQTNSNRKPTVGTILNCIAPTPAAWLCRKVFRGCDRPCPLLAMYLATVD